MNSHVTHTLTSPARRPSPGGYIDDVVEGFENSVRQPVLPHELPDIFLAVEFGCAWRELQERDVVWNLEGLGAMPSGLIEEENSVSARRDFAPAPRSGQTAPNR
jgi:hypothetical protein